MAKRQAIAGLLIMALFASIALFLSRHDSGPDHHGKTIHQWVSQLTANNWRATFAAQEALKSIGPERAVPMLADKLAARPIVTSKTYQTSFRKLPPLISRRLPAPIDLFDYRMRVFDALSQFDGKDLKPVLPVLIRIVQTSDQGARFGAVYLLGKIGTNATCALPFLWTQLREGLAVRPLSHEINIAEAIQQIDPHSAKLADLLTQWLVEDNLPAPIKVQTIRILGRIGNVASPAVPLLIRFSNSQDEDLSSESNDAIWRIEHDLTRHSSILSR